MRSSTVAVAVLAGLGLALAGCGSDDGGDDGDGGQSTPSPAPESPTAPADGMASCLVGDWRSTGVGIGQTGLQLEGGSGVAMSIAPDGAATTDFTGMEPITFTGEAVEVNVAGTLTYDGQAEATMQTGTDAETGDWEPAEADWADIRVTLDVTEPTQNRPLDQAPIGEGIEGAESWAGDVVDVEPVLGQGSYQCHQDGTVVLTSAGAVGLTWTFTPA